MKDENMLSDLVYQQAYSAAKENAEALSKLIQEDKEEVKKLLNKQDDSGNTILHIAVQYNTKSLECLMYVFKDDAYKSLIEVKNNNGRIALHLAAECNAESLQLLINLYGNQVLEVKNSHGSIILQYRPSVYVRCVLRQD
ncbi:MAG: ankyrin repeat domain-containing protein [Candidatus Lariskella arthropodorum]